MRKNSIKNTRVNAEVQRELSNILRGGIKDPRVSPMTSVVAVEVAPDLKTCKAYISVLGDEKAQLVFGIAGIGEEHLDLLAKICEVLEDEEVLEKMKTTDDIDWIMERLS